MYIFDEDSANLVYREDQAQRAWEQEQKNKLTGVHSPYKTFEKKLARKAYIFPQPTYSEEINSMVF